jgi:hypothetical protein
MPPAEAFILKISSSESSFRNKTGGNCQELDKNFQRENSQYWPRHFTNYSM